MRFKQLVRIFGFALCVISAPSIFAQAIEVSDVQQSVRDGQFNTARAQLAQISQNPIDRIFLEVDIAQSEGRIDDAVDLLRQLIAIAPQFLPARQRLAGLLVSDRRFNSAKFHYEELTKIDPNPEADEFYLKRISEIDDLNKFSYGFDLRIVPSDNINNASTAEEQCFLALGLCSAVPEELKAQSGVKIAPSLSATYRHNVADHQQLALNIDARAEKYSVDTLDSYSFTITPSWRYTRSQYGFDANVFWGRRIGDGEVYSTRSTFGGGSTVEIQSVDERSSYYGFGFGFNRKLTNKAALQASFNRRFTTYDDQDNYGYLDSITTTVDAASTYRVNPRNELSGGLTYRDYDENLDGPDDWHRDYQGLTGRVGLRTVWESGFITDIGLSYGEREYGNVNNISDSLGSAAVVRHDYETQFLFSAQNNNWSIGGFVPKLNCSVDSTNSNIANYDYDRTLNCGFALSSRF